MLSFSDVAKVFAEIETRSGRLEMTDILAELFRKADSREIGKLVYFVQGIVAPPFEGIDLGLGEKFAIEAIAFSSGHSKKEVEMDYRESGDLGLTAEHFAAKKRQLSLSAAEMDVDYIYSALLKIAKTSGPGSNELKKKYLIELLNNSSPPEACFIIRFVLGRLRLGVGDPTILDALSVAKKEDKSWREPLERAYNICADMGYVARIFYEDENEIAKFTVQPFKPLMPALAERLATPEEIIEKIGTCGVERKYDGFRLQCHKKEDRVELYSRKLEKMTRMFPDVVAAIKDLKRKEIIFEAEALAYNAREKRFYPFQQTMHRRRKHGIEEALKELPLNLFCFDVMYLDGKDLTEKPYKERRKVLEKIFPKDVLKLSEMTVVDKPKKIKEIFDDSLGKGLEGIMAKDLDSPYTAGKRKFAWIKLKKSYGKSVDTIDGVIVGYYLGKGARAEFKFGGLLVAVYNPDRGRFETVAKIGSGFTEEEMIMLQEMLEKIKAREPSLIIDYRTEPDFWVELKYVVEVAFDDITLSPTHTCGLHEGKGYALRFPRLMSFREDKGIKEVTTTKEVIEMYELMHK
jgi:DNA ligase-1